MVWRIGYISLLVLLYSQMEIFTAYLIFSSTVWDTANAWLKQLSFKNNLPFSELVITCNSP